MSRPFVERVARSVRLPAGVDDLVVRYAKEHGLSVNQVIEYAVRAFLQAEVVTYAPKPALPKPASRSVTPRFKGAK